MNRPLSRLYPTVLIIAIVVAITLSFVVTPPAECKPLRKSALANVTAGDSDDAPKSVVERVTFRDGGQERTVAGRIIVEAADGSVVVQTDDGQLTTVDAEKLVRRERTSEEFKPLTADELGQRLLQELPAGFRIHTTPHYVVCYDTSREYAEWVSSMYERLYRAFTNYWSRAGLELHEPEFPLVVIAFADRGSYEAASRKDLGGSPGGIVGYYSLKSNRVTTYDLTGVESLHAGNRRGSSAEINQMLSQPAAVPLVATIVHEATHQITFNCGLQQRLADIPLWQAEGMAMYFEAPDLTSRNGWRGIGKVNYPRLETFRRNLPSWRHGSLESLLVDSQRFHDPRVAIAAYADSWALNYYLIKYHPKEYAAYMKVLAEKRPLLEDDRATRLAEFKEHFGNVADVEQDFLKQMSRVQ